MAKFCANGHEMHESWSDCPYCQRTGFQRAGQGDGLAKTRIEARGGEGSLGASWNREAAGKTILLSDVRKPPIVGWLVAMNGKHQGEDFRLREGKNVIGSSSASEVSINDPAVSVTHASIRYADGVFTITDLDSKNGTFLNNGAQAIARQQLNDNDIIRVGEVSLKFKCL